MQEYLQRYNDVSIGDWPQRLLHVPSMTSYEWQDGHRYGTHVRPRYNAISYTWGRYELRDPDDQPDVKAIDIQGVTWVIPRINESHFTVAQFEKLIRRSVEAGMSEKRNAAFTQHPEVEFVWLDVACINQTPGHPQKAIEIGRQARIFRRAKRVLIWLNHSKHETLDEALKCISQAAAIAEDASTKLDLGKQSWALLPGSKPRSLVSIWKRWYNRTKAKARLTFSSSLSRKERGQAQAALTGGEEWLTSAITNIKVILQERWFSSLWTLQEAFLCQWAYFISGELEPLRLDSPQLNSLFESCQVLSNRCKASVAQKLVHGHPPVATTENELIGEVERSGLAALATSNAMVLYTVASNRVSWDPADRIYGIMQIFGLQLGISDPEQGTLKPFTLPELELQLGQRLIKQFPLMSQLHVHTRPIEVGQGWKISSTSIVPELFAKIPFYVTSSLYGEHTLLCELSYTERDGNCWGYFSGKLCHFHKLHKAWKLAEHKIVQHNRSQSIHQIALDVNELFPQEPSADNLYEALPQLDRQHRLAERIESCFDGVNMSASVLLLGHYGDEHHTEDWWKLTGGHVPGLTGDSFQIGLILARQEVREIATWRRIGICTWDLNHPGLRREDSAHSLLRGSSADWEQGQGLFG